MRLWNRLLLSALFGVFAGCGSDSANSPPIAEATQSAIEAEDAAIDAAESAND